MGKPPSSGVGLLQSIVPWPAVGRLPWEPWREAGGETLWEKSLGLVGFNTEALLEQKAVWSVCLGPVCFICNLQGLNGAGSFGSEASMEPF